MLYFCPERYCSIEAYSRIGEVEPNFKFCPIHGNHLIGKKCGSCESISSTKTHSYCKHCGELLIQVEA